ncbi:MAG: hypothetical protein JWM28_772 [Chitinophagaceae bacterium]|nr:hypothetical protein [Chitinophagaceae bacterium]
MITFLQRPYHDWQPFCQWPLLLVYCLLVLHNPSSAAWRNAASDGYREKPCRPGIRPPDKKSGQAVFRTVP